jgi:hypothetical protein
MTAWPAAPIMRADWKELDATENTAVAARLGTAVAESELKGIATIAMIKRFRAAPLSFYKNWLLIEFEVELPDNDRGLASFLYGPGTRIVLLDFTATAINTVNATALGSLDLCTTGPDYLRFVVGHTVGDEHRFQIIESREDLPLTRKADLERLSPVLSKIRPVEGFAATNVDGAQRLDFAACVLFGDALFEAKFRVEMGKVDMIDDSHLGTLPVRVERIAPPFRIVDLDA